MPATQTIDHLYHKQRAAYPCLRRAWALDPERYCRERLALKPTWQQRHILEAITPDGARVSVRSGHNIGKDAIAAGIILWFMETRDFARVPCTAPTGHQLYDVLWGELAKWMRKSEQLSRTRGDHPRFWLTNLFRHTQDMLYDLSAPREWYAVARTARKENPEGLQGFHASDIELDDAGEMATIHSAANLLIIVDEASGVPDEVQAVIEGAMASPGARELLIGNPTRNAGFFAASHKQQRGEYTTLHFRTADSPLADPDYRNRLVRKFGEGSNVVRVRADGEFPKADDDTLIPLEWAEAAIERNPEGRQPQGKRRLGVDVAWQGGDRTALVVRHDFLVPHIGVYGKLEPMETVGHTVRTAEEWQVDEIAVDIIGMGAGVYSRLGEVMQERKLARQWYCTVTAVNVALTAPARPQDKDAQAHRLRDYLWLEMRDWLRDAAPCFLADNRDAVQDLAGELSTPKFGPDSHGFIVVESKDAMRTRLKRLGGEGGGSPDIADALGCTFAPLGKRIGTW